MQAGKRQKSDGSDFGAHPSDHLRGLVSSLEEALDSSDIGADQGAETASILAQTAETCIGSGDAGRACANILSSMLEGLEAESGRLQAALDLHSLPDVPDYCRAEPSVGNAKRAATYAHRLSYTTFAPPVVLGQNLFRPPAPQDFDFRASCLHDLARDLPAEATTAAGTSPAVAPESMTQHPAEPALPPPDLGTTAGSSHGQPEEPPEAAKKPEAPGFTSSAFDFILNPDVEEVDEEFSSSEAESD